MHRSGMSLRLRAAALIAALGAGHARDALAQGRPRPLGRAEARGLVSSVRSAGDDLARLGLLDPLARDNRAIATADAASIVRAVGDACMQRRVADAVCERASSRGAAVATSIAGALPASERAGFVAFARGRQGCGVPSGPLGAPGMLSLMSPSGGALVLQGAGGGALPPATAHACRCDSECALMRGCCGGEPSPRHRLDPEDRARCANVACALRPNTGGRAVCTQGRCAVEGVDAASEGPREEAPVGSARVSRCASAGEATVNPSSLSDLGRRLAPMLTRAYRRELRANPALGGSVTLALTFDASRALARATFEGASPGVRLIEPALEAALRGLRFPGAPTSERVECAVSFAREP